MIGSQVGTHPFPNIVGYFQKVIGEEAHRQILEAEDRIPDSVFACVGGGANSIGLFQSFINEKSVKIYGAEVHDIPVSCSLFDRLHILNVRRA